METEVKFDCSGVDWELVAGILQRVDMAYYAPALHEKAFKNSYVTVFIYTNNQLVGFGRAISDGAYQAAVYDLAVTPDFQKRGLGNTILKHVISRLPQCNIILYASPGKESFYINHDFRKMNTGMASFINTEIMKKKGFTD